MAAINQIRIFLASPGDVPAERDLARKVIDETNRTIATPQGITIKIVGWDTDTFPQYGGDPQSIVNAQIADMAKYDLFVGIPGTFTPRN